MKTKRIFLTGFMGAGKSTLGLIIANSLGWEFIDIDRFIEKNEGIKVTEIFKLKGEEYFRKKEIEALVFVMSQEKVIVSLGGGTISNQQIVDYLKKNGKMIYLQNNLDNLYKRLRYKTDRPLFQTIDGIPMTEQEARLKIKNMLDEREKFYLQADIIYNISNSSVGITADKLIHLIKSKF